MATRQERSDAANNRRQKQAWGRTITVTRDGVGYSFTAWPSEQVFTRAPTATGGATILRADAVYLFDRADAEAVGYELPPRLTDTITDPTVTDDVTGAPKVFQPKTPTNETAWRYQNAAQTVVRVHCQRKS